MRVLLMLLTWIGAGYMVYLIATGQGGVFQYIAAAMCVGSGLYQMFSLVENP